MCFSATANFAGSAVLGTIGVATLAEVKQRRALMFSAMPLLFAAHQFIEGFVWLGIIGLLIVMITMRYAFTSIWCAYAAVVNVLIYFHFRRRRRVPPVIYATAA